MAATSMTRRRRLSALWMATRLGFRADPWRMTLSVVIRTVTSSGMALSALFVSRLIADIADQDLDSARLNAAVVVVTGGGIMTFLATYGLDLRFRMEVAVSGLVERELIEMSTSLVSIEHHEREEYVTEVELLRAQRATLANTAAAVFENAGSLVALFTSVSLLGSVHPALLGLPLFAVPVVAATVRSQQRTQRATEEVAPRLREARHLEDLCTTAPPAKEVRVFGLGALLRRREGAERDAAEERVYGVTVGNAVAEVAAWTVFGSAYAGSIVFVVLGAVDGRFGLPDVVLVVTLAGQVAGNVANAVGMAAWLAQTLITVGRYEWLRGEVARLAPQAAGTGGVVPARIEHGIDLDHVSFTYPGTETEVLSDIHVHLPAGATVAIVGDNGAGKSTLVKLLMRLYDPSDGRITVDGTDLSTIDAADWREAVSAGFQDHCRFEFEARRTVGVGHLPELDDDEAVRRALDRAASTAVIDQLSQGLDTPLGRSFDEGAELSGGQWQKLALGRAMMRAEPKLLVLDEPTSALDAETEHELFVRYAAAAREVAARTGGITVLVSHRFSTVRIADLIVVLDGHRLAEVGSHADLVAAGGLYAELYELQARAYR